MFEPRIDVVDAADGIKITAELPGMAREDLEILMEDKALILRGEKKLESTTDEKGCYRTERAFGFFRRTIPLPDGLDIDRAQASFDKGVLTISIPKSATAESSNARKLPIH